MKSLFKISIISSLLFCVFVNTSCTSEMVDIDPVTNIECDADGNYIFNASMNDSESGCLIDTLSMSAPRRPS